MDTKWLHCMNYLAGVLPEFLILALPNCEEMGLWFQRFGKIWPVNGVINGHIRIFLVLQEMKIFGEIG